MRRDVKYVPIHKSPIMPRPLTGRPNGRPKGSINKASAKLKELCGRYDAEIIEELKKIAGFGMSQKIARNGVPVVDAKGKPVMVKNKGSKSDGARMQAMNMLWERAHGKPTQKLAGDSTEDPISVTKIEFEDVPVGHPLANNSNSLSDEDETEEQESKVA